MERDLIEDVRVSLDNKNLWDRFNNIGTEMVITKNGRRMFPFVEISIQGLEPEAQYIVMLDIASVNGLKYRYDEPSNCWTRWKDAAASQFHPLAVGSYVHPASPHLGRELTKGISFNKVKLTNNPSGTAFGQIVLESMFLYVPRLYILTTNDFHKKNWDKALVFMFKETEFVAVTAYMNRVIAQLKIENNPFARAFREDGQSGVKIKNRRTGSPCDEATKKAAVNDNNADEDDSSPELQRSQQEQTEIQPFMYRIQDNKGDDEIQVFHVSPSSIVVTDLPPSPLPLPNWPSSSSIQTIQDVSSDEMETQDRAPSPQFPPPSVSDHLPMIVSVGSVGAMVNFSKNNATNSIEVMSDDNRLKGIYHEMYKLPPEKDVGDSRSAIEALSRLAQGQDSAITTTLIPVDASKEVQDAHLEKMSSIIKYENLNRKENVSEDRGRWLTSSNADSRNFNALQSRKDTNEDDSSNLLHCIAGNHQHLLSESGKNIKILTYNLQQPLSIHENPSTGYNVCNTPKTASKSSNCTKERSSSLDENVESLMSDMSSKHFSECEPSEDVTFIDLNTQRYSVSSGSFPCGFTQSWFDDSLLDDNQPIINCSDDCTRARVDLGKDGSIIIPEELSLSEKKAVIGKDKRTQDLDSKSFGHLENTGSVQGKCRPASPITDRSIPSVENLDAFSRDRKMHLKSKAFEETIPSKVIKSQSSHSKSEPEENEHQTPFLENAGLSIPLMKYNTTNEGLPIPLMKYTNKPISPSEESCLESRHVTHPKFVPELMLYLKKEAIANKQSNDNGEESSERTDGIDMVKTCSGDTQSKLASKNDNSFENSKVDLNKYRTESNVDERKYDDVNNNNSRSENSDIKRNRKSTVNNSVINTNGTVKDINWSCCNTKRDTNSNTNDFTGNGLHRECDRDQIRTVVKRRSHKIDERSEEIISYSPDSSDDDACLHTVRSPGIINLKNEENREEGEFVDESEETFSEFDTLEDEEENSRSESRNINFEKARVSSSSEDINDFIVFVNSTSFPELRIQDANPTAVEHISQEKNALAEDTQDYTKSGRKNNDVQAAVSRSKEDDVVFSGTVFKRTVGAISVSVDRNVNNTSFDNTPVTSSPQQPLTSSTSYAAGTLESPTAAETSSPSGTFKERTTLAPPVQPLQNELIATKSPSFLQQPLKSTTTLPVVSTLQPSGAASAVRDLSALSSLSVPTSASINPSLLPNIAQSEGLVQTSSKVQQHKGPQENSEAPLSCIKARGSNRWINLIPVAALNVSKRQSDDSGPSVIENKIARVDAPAPRNGTSKLGLHQKPVDAVEGLAKDVKTTQAKEQRGIVSNRSSESLQRIVLSIQDVLRMAHKEDRQEPNIQPPGAEDGAMDGSSTKRNISNLGQEDNMIRHTQRFRQQHENEITAENQRPYRSLRQISVTPRAENMPDHIPGSRSSQRLEPNTNNAARVQESGQVASFEEHLLSRYHIPTATGSLFHVKSPSNSATGEQSASMYSNTTNCLNDVTFPHADVPATIKIRDTIASGLQHELQHGNNQEQVSERWEPYADDFGDTVRDIWYMSTKRKRQMLPENARKYGENCAETNDQPIPSATTTLPNRSGSMPFRSQVHMANFPVIESQNRGNVHRLSVQNDGNKFILVEEERRTKTVQQPDSFERSTSQAQYHHHSPAVGNMSWKGVCTDGSNKRKTPDYPVIMNYFSLPPSTATPTTVCSQQIGPSQVVQEASKNENIDHGEEGLVIQNSTSSRCQHANETKSLLLPDNSKQRYDCGGFQGDGAQRNELLHRSLDLHQGYQYNMERYQKAAGNDKGTNLYEDNAYYSTLYEAQSPEVIPRSRDREYDYFSVPTDNRQHRESAWLPEELYYHHQKRTYFDAAPLEVLYNFHWPAVDRRMPDARLSEIYSATRSTFTYYSASLMCSTIPLESTQQRRYYR